MGGRKGENIILSELFLQENVSELYQEVVKFSICNHLIWSTWAVIQAVNSKIDFDYMDYARQRVEQYRFVKDKM